jgi:WD40 repeat protein
VSDSRFDSVAVGYRGVYSTAFGIRMLVRCTQASEDLTLRVWDASNMKVTQELRGHTDIQARSNSLRMLPLCRRGAAAAALLAALSRPSVLCTAYALLAACRRSAVQCQRCCGTA